ncbi:MAG: hypothetical protein ACXVX4_15860, partial [Mycobacterium sp.]
HLVVAADVGGVGAPVVQIPPKSIGDRAGQLDGCRCFDAQRGAPFCSTWLGVWQARPVYSAVFGAAPEIIST